MGSFWNDKSIQMYEDAANLLDYPEIPLKSFFQQVISAEDTVLEIGSGVGIVSLYLAPMCKRLIAVEEDIDGCENLTRRMKERGITNIDVINTTWPSQILEPADVTISLYIYKAFNTIEKVRDLLKSTLRAGIIMGTQPRNRVGFHQELSEYLGLAYGNNQSCINDCCRTAALLEAEGAEVRCEKVLHEFGQPVNDLEAAAQFMLKQLKLNDSYLDKILPVAENFTEIRSGRLYVPMQRTNCVVVFEK